MTTVPPTPLADRRTDFEMPRLCSVAMLTPDALAADLDGLADFLHTTEAADAALPLGDYLSDLAATVRVSAAARRAA